MKEHFCCCSEVKCPYHPSNHDNGCDPCIKKNLKNNEIPSCFFHAVNDDTSELTDFSAKCFVDFYLKHNGK